jgi:hypothetical protein
MKRDPSNMDIYVQFLCYFGLAITGTSFWNNNKMNKSANELVTISDEAFIHLCIINYSATWKAQEKRKDDNYTVKILISIVHCLASDAYCKQLTALLLVVSKVHQGYSKGQHIG